MYRRRIDFLFLVYISVVISLKKRIKIIAVVALIGVMLLGIFCLARAIIDNSYSSLEIVQEQVVEEEIMAPEVTQEPLETEGAHGFISDEEVQGIAESSNIPDYVARVLYLLTLDNSPYKDLNLDYVESDLENGEKVISIIDSESNELLVDVYCNSVDYGSYMYVKKEPFSEEEDTFYMAMGNGETGEHDGEYYWYFY